VSKQPCDLLFQLLHGCFVASHSSRTLDTTCIQRFRTLGSRGIHCIKEKSSCWPSQSTDLFHQPRLPLLSAQAVRSWHHIDQPFQGSLVARSTALRPSTKALRTLQPRFSSPPCRIPAGACVSDLVISKCRHFDRRDPLHMPSFPAFLGGHWAGSRRPNPQKDIN
jgi:hypothetical protein